MTREFQSLMKILTAAATGIPVPFDDKQLDWNRVLELAGEQQIKTLFACGLTRYPDISCPAESRNRLKARMRSSAIRNTLRRTAIIRLLGDMEAAGIRAVLLKGYAVADGYASPECRTSADTDIWVAPDDEQRACDFLAERGFKVEPRWEHGHHAVCHHPTMGCVELHVILYDEIVEEIWFGKMDGSEFVMEPRLRIDTPDGSYYTLGYTDHMIFLTLHAVKHFINSGMSLRMMTDVALFMRKNKEQIDTERFWKTINDLSYGKLVNCILWAMVDYCGFESCDFPGIDPQRPGQVEAVLEDLEQGGWMGFNDKEAREDGWHEYNRQIMLKKRKPWQYKLYMLIWQWGGLKDQLFPDREYMVKRYPYVENKPYLMPCAWMHRLIVRGTMRLKDGTVTRRIVDDADKLSDAGKQRVRLFKSLSMLK